MKQKLIGILAAVAFASNLSAQSVNTVVSTNLSEPFGVVADGNGVIYVTDAANNRIEKFDVTTGIKTTLAGALQSGSANGIGSQARFWYPQGLVAARGGLVVADSANDTIRFVGFNGAVSNIAGLVGDYSFADGVGAAARFANPLGMATDTNGNIYIADSGNNRIRKLATNDAVTTVVSGGLYEPAGVSVGDNGDLWVADTRHHVIKRFNSSGTLTLTVGLSGSSGTNDADLASDARFSSPRGVLWLGGNTGLLISDSGNHTIRRLYPNPNNGDFFVETLAGTPGQSGLVNGTPGNSKFNSPISLSRDPVNGGFLIVDRANNAVRRLQTSPPLPPVSAPIIGYVTFPPTARLSVLVPVTSAVFNNDVIIAVITEGGTETFFTVGPTPPSSFEDTIPFPNASTGGSPPLYQDGLTESEVAAIGTMVSDTLPDMTIKIIGTQDGRQSSPLVQARFQFKTANPSIVGDNAASFVLNNITTGAQMWYTLDGSDPTNNPTANPAVVGPLDTGAQISLLISNNVTFKVRAFRTDYEPSEVSIKIFSPTNFVANRISFGFENSEASSDFIASAGQKFYAPVTLSILPNQPMYSLQFNITVTNMTAPPVAPGAIGFQSMLQEKLPGNVFRTIPPAMLAGVAQVLVTNVVGGTTNITTITNLVFQDLLFTNTLNNDNLLGVGWLARSGLSAVTPNLFDVTSQDLIDFSIAKDTLFTKENSKIVLGAYAFDIPLNAADGSTYFIKIDRPSATTDGFGGPGSDIYIESPSQGSLTNGSINGRKIVTVGHRKYVVGDVYPFKWLNAGDFGDTNLLSVDVAQVFQTSTYGLNSPVPGSDLEDAMDSCCGTAAVNGDGYLQQNGTNSGSTLFDGNDLVINDFVFGDGVLDVRDVFVTFRRSLDPSLTWYKRFWFNGNRVAETTPNLYNGARPAPVEVLAAKSSEAADGSSATPFINFTIGDVTGAPGQTVSLPIQAQVIGDYPLRVLQLNVTVQAVDGSPIITNAIQFTPAAALGQPSMVMSSGLNNYSAAWLNNGIVGLSGTTTIGTLQVKIPAGATTASAYRVHFDHISASPNGLARFDQQIQDGLLLLANRDASSWGDNIPDTWRLRYFGSLGNALSQASADADGDGASNWTEYKAGTNPNDVSSYLRLLKPRKEGGLVLRWPSVGNKNYVIESSPALFGEEWSVLSTNIAGNGQELEFTDSTPINGSRFYRIRVLDE